MEQCWVTCLNWRPHLQFNSYSTCVLNLNDLDPTSHSRFLWHIMKTTQHPGPMAHFFLTPTPTAPHSIQRIFKVITSSKRPLWMHSANILTLFGFFWTGSERFSHSLVAWFTTYEAARPERNSYKLDPEPMGLDTMYLPPNALKGREHHLW